MTCNRPCLKRFFRPAILLIVVGSLCAQSTEQLRPWQLLMPTTPLGEGNGLVAPSQSSSSGNPSGTVHAFSVASSSVYEAITPELQALADSLDRDPVRVFEWVRNNVAYVPYSNAMRGAHMTWQDRVGNTRDQSILLAVLLRACQSDRVGQIQYVQGTLKLPLTRASGEETDVTKWLGVSAAGIPSFAEDFGWTVSGDGMEVGAIWVNAVIDNQTVSLLPWFKSSDWSPAPIDVNQVLGMSLQDEVFFAAGGTDLNPTATSTSIKGMSPGAVRGKLAQHASALARACRSDALLSKRSGLELIGGGSIHFNHLEGKMPPSLAPGVTVLKATATYAFGSFPESGVGRFSMSFLGKTKTWYLPELAGRKLAIWFDSANSNRAEVWLGDELVVADDGTAFSESIAAAQANTALTLELVTDIRSQSKPSGLWPITRGQAVAIIYGIGNLDGRLRSALDRQARYVAAGLANTSRELKTEDLNVIATQYWLLNEVCCQLMAGLEQWTYVPAAVAGFVTGKDAPGVSMTNWIAGLLPKNDSGHTRAERDEVRNKLFWSVTYLASGMEYGTIQLSVGSTVPAYSTTRVMEWAMQQGTEVRLVSDLADFNTLRNGGTLSGYFSSEMKIMEEAIDIAKERVLVPLSGQISIPSSSPAATTAGWIGGGFRIRGGFNGGGVPAATPVKSEAVAANTNTSTTAATGVAQNQSKTGTSEPIDLTNGAYYYDHEDLVVGTGSAPTGLSLARNYNSNRRSLDPTGLGKGWTHSYDMRATVRNVNDLSLERASAGDLAPLLVGARAILDLWRADGGGAKKQVLCSIVGNWVVDQFLGSRVAISLGDRTIEFTRLPDGSFSPPAGVTATLTQDTSYYSLAFRHGNTIRFHAPQATPRAKDGKLDRITDPYGRYLEAGYDSSGRLQTVTDAYARTLTFAYETDGRLSKVTDSTGRKVLYGRDAAGNFTFADAENAEATPPAVTTFLADSGGRVTGIVDARGRTLATNTYDAWDRVVQQRSHGLDARLWTVGIAPGVGRQTNPLNGSRIGTQTNAIRGTDWFYFDARGRKVAQVDAIGNVTRWLYDGADRLVKTISPRGAYAKYEYNSEHFMTRETVSDGTAEGAPSAADEKTREIVPDDLQRPKDVYNFEGQKTSYTYTAQHQVETVTSPGGIVSWYEYYTTGTMKGGVKKFHPAAYAQGATRASDKVITYLYDAYGGLDRITYPDSSEDLFWFTPRGDLELFVDRNSVQTSYGYNHRRQRISTTRWFHQNGDGVAPTGQATNQTFYDVAGDVDYTLDEANRRTDYDYDVDGHLVEARAGAAQVVTLSRVYEERGWLESVSDALSRSTVFGYDDAGHVTSTTAPLDRITQQSYDADGNPLTTTSPLLNTTTNAYDWRGRAYGIETGRAGDIRVTADFGYDGDGRRKSLGNRRSHEFNWVFDDTHRTVSLTTPEQFTTVTTSNVRGLPESVTEGNATRTTTFTTYDDEGRLKEKTDGVGTTTYQYWPNGLLKNVTEGGRTTYREYDDFNRLKRYDDGEGNTIAYTYYPDDRLKELAYPSQNRRVTYTYDDFGRLETVTDWANRVTTYHYDNAGQLKGIDLPNDTRRRFEYDDAGRLFQIKDTLKNSSVVYFQHLDYDKDDRPKASFRRPAPSTQALPADAATFDQDNRLATWNTQSVTFDAFGNMTRGPLADGVLGDYNFDARNRLQACAGVSSRYSPDGLRVAVTDGAGTTNYAIDPNAALSRVLVRKKPGGGETFYVYGLGLLYEDDGAGVVSYHYDLTGSTTALVGSDGNTVKARWDYSSYGSILQQQGTYATPFLLHGLLGVMRDANGLYFMRARFYNARMMQFVNADPIGFAGGLNWHAAFGSNPIGTVDPWGLCEMGVLERMWVTATRIPEPIRRLSEQIDSSFDYAARNTLDPNLYLLVNRAVEVAPTAMLAFAPQMFLRQAVAETNIWQMNRFVRGGIVEEMLGANLPQNFPTIDRFANGVATSIKSVDLSAASYQNTSTLARLINGYVDKVAAFNGQTWAGVSIDASQITARQLQLAVPSAGTAAQQGVLVAAVQRAYSMGVQLIVTRVP